MFSVLIASYNHSQYLVEAVESALNSAMVGEVLIVDDGSTDRSREIIAGFDRPFYSRVRVLDSAPAENLGAHARWNQLVEAASNEWVAPLNSDDVFPTDRFAQVSASIAAGNADLYFGDLFIINERSERVGYRNSICDNEVPWQAGADLNAAVSDGRWLDFFRIQNLAATTTNMVFTKSLHRKIGGFSNFRFAHDWDFILRAILLGRIYYNRRILSGYRIHGNNTISASRTAIRREVEALFEQLPELPAQSHEALGTNPYLRRRKSLDVAVVSEPGSSTVNVAATEHLNDLGMRACGRNGEPRPDFVYAPVTADGLLSRFEFENAVLAMEVAGNDFVVVSRDFHSPTELVLGGSEAMNQVLFRESAFEALQASGNGALNLAGRVIHLPCQDVENKFSAEEIFPGGTKLSVDAGANLVLGSGAAKMGSSSRNSLAALPASFVSKSDKPVIFVLPAFLAVGGVENLLLEIVKQLHEEFEFVLVCTERLRKEQGSLISRFEGLARYFDLSACFSTDQFGLALEWLRDCFDPRLVWIVNGAPWQIENTALLRSIFADVPFCDHQVYDENQGWIQYFKEPALRASESFIAVNSRIEKTFVDQYQLPADQIELIYHCIDTENSDPGRYPEKSLGPLAKSMGLDRSLRYFCFVGRLTAQKNPVLFLQLAQQAQGDDTHFLLVGDGELAAECDRFIDQNSLSNVTRMPFVADLAGLYALASGLIVTSDYEGLPLAMLQAMAMGLPVLTTDVGDIAKVLGQYGSGVIVEQPGDLQNFTAAYDRWLARLPQLKAEAERGSSGVRERFSGSTVAQQYRQVFESLIGGTAS